MKWTALILTLVVGVIGGLARLQSKALRSASSVVGKHQLRVAAEGFARTGQITNYATSGYRVRLSTNVATIGSSQYHCFFEVTGGWGYGGGILAMTTNGEFIWLDPERGPKRIADGYRPSAFSKRY